MYKHLYDNFKHWYRGGSVYFYSDPHFADDEMKYLRKYYIGDDEQVKAINRKIGKNDTFVCLGDVCDLEYVRKIRGYKVLICGNHDKGASNYKRANIELIYNADTYTAGEARKAALAQYPNYRIVSCEKKLRVDDSKELWNIYSDWVVTLDNCLFDEVYEGPLCIAEKIILSHEPLDIPCMLNIHGHCHDGGPYDKTHLNVCAEHIGYCPISIKEIINSGVLGKINSIHRETIDKATKRKNKRK